MSSLDTDLTTPPLVPAYRESDISTASSDTLPAAGSFPEGWEDFVEAKSWNLHELQGRNSQSLAIVQLVTDYRAISHQTIVQLITDYRAISHQTIVQLITDYRAISHQRATLRGVIGYKTPANRWFFSFNEFRALLLLPLFLFPVYGRQK